MAYGTPAGDPSGSMWNMHVRDTTTGAVVGFSSTALGDFPLADFESLCQKIITVIDADTDLELTLSNRTYITTQPITP